MLKNTAGQKLYVLAYDATTGLPKVGDAANLSARVAKDHAAAAALADTAATELDATNQKGWYVFDLAQAETNADHLRFAAQSVTANIVCLCFPTVDEPYSVATSVPAVLTSAGLDAVAVESGLNLRQAVSILLAYTAGVKTNVTTTGPTVKNPAGDATRATPTVDADGNCSANTLSPPA
jgi:hypothetical protein